MQVLMRTISNVINGIEIIRKLKSDGKENIELKRIRKVRTPELIQKHFFKRTIIRFL